MANGFVDGIGYPMNGGLSAGIRMAKERQEQERQRGLASGFTQYMNAQDDAGKRAALSQMAQYDPNTAFNLMKYEQELANKDKMTPYQQATLDLQRKQFERGEQLTPYQQAQLDIQRQQLANQGKMNEYQTWQKDEALRKEQEAKEKEKLLGDALYRYQTAQEEEAKNVALADVYRASPDFAKDILKKQKEAEKKGFGNSELGLILDVRMHPENYPPEVVQFVEGYSRVKLKDPSIRGMNEYEGAVGKQYAEAGMPYGNVGQVQPEPVQSTLPSTFGLYTQEQAPQAQGMPTQAQPIPTAAQLAADKKRAEKEAEDELERKNVDIDLSKKEPVLREALEEARQALRSGVGSGVIEGYATKFGLNPFGWVDDTAENNYAAIESANKLINQYIRQSLKNSGLTGRELDSKAESERYMYNITPFDNERINERRIDNFIRDYLEGSKSLSAQPQEEIIYYEDL